jgi:hypothetical protein
VGTPRPDLGAGRRSSLSDQSSLYEFVPAIASKSNRFAVFGDQIPDFGRVAPSLSLVQFPSPDNLVRGKGLTCFCFAEIPESVDS